MTAALGVDCIDDGFLNERAWGEEVATLRGFESNPLMVATSVVLHCTLNFNRPGEPELHIRRDGKKSREPQQVP